MLFSRQDDSSPYYAGAKTLDCGGDRATDPIQYHYGCTTGFAVRHGGTTKLLTAGHCGDNGDAMYDGGRDYMGRIQGLNPGRDTMIVASPMS